MKLRRLLITLPIIFLPLSSCDDLFEKAGDINNYVGHYVLDHATERTYHVYWNNKTLVSEKTLMQSCSFTINEDKSVLFIDYNGKEYKGKIKCLEKYCRFYKTPLESGHKYYLRYDKALYYSYESKHMSVEYDVTYRDILFYRS